MVCFSLVCLVLLFVVGVIFVCPVDLLFLFHSLVSLVGWMTSATCKLLNTKSDHSAILLGKGLATWPGLEGLMVEAVSVFFLFWAFLFERPQSLTTLRARRLITL